jgi:anionic cell wall polymer biosynthesis LytR-Cps2A-Psr (LCP) family protein
MLGGVEYNVEKRMYTPEEGIDLQAGRQRLDGEGTLWAMFGSGKMRWGTSVGWSGNRNLCGSLLDQLLNVSTITRLPELISIFNENVKTDLTVGELISLANNFKDMSVII